MDPISHAVVGSAIGALAPAAVPAYMVAAVGASISPDVDFVVRWWGGDNAYLDHHRGATHGPVGLALLALGISGLTVLLLRGTPWPQALLWSALGLLSHVFLDLTNAYGTQALWPMRRTRYAWDWTSIVDLWILGLPLAGWLLVWMTGWPRQAVFVGVLAAITGYIALRARVHGQLLAAVRRQFPQATRASVLPGLIGLNRWRYVVEQGRRYATGRVVWRPLAVEPGRQWEPPEDEVVAASRQAPSVQLMLRFGRHVVASWWQEEGRYVVRWTDLRYDMGGYSPFTAYAWLRPDLTLVDDRLGGDRSPRFTRERLRAALNSDELPAE